jgi:predicted DNA-binding transcriptional regulator YafY
VDKLERLLNLTAALLHTTRPLTADELRTRVAGYPDNLVAFRRAFERDKDDLREMGIPLSIETILYEDRHVDAYRILESDYYLRDPGLEPDELAALNLALSAVRLDGVHGVEALWKLGGVAGDSAAEPTELAALPSDPSLVPLFSGIVDRRTATFLYNSAERTAERTIEPYRLDFRRGRWYVTGLDRLSADERVFRLDRVEGDVGLGEPGGFDPPEDRGAGPVEPWEFGEGEPVLARLLVDGQQAALAEQHLGSAAVVESLDDGSKLFEVAVTNWPAFRSFVLSFLEHAELVAPDDLRAELVDWLRALAGDGDALATEGSR